MSGPGHIWVEGEGEESGAVNNLVTRLWQNLGLPPSAWRPARRFPKLHRDRELVRACDVTRSAGVVGALLILMDLDDGCPRDHAPRRAQLLRDRELPFPVAYVVFHREFETLFLASIRSIAGRDLVVGGVRRPGVIEGTSCPFDPEERRDAKGWLSKHMPPGRAYKPTIDQLPMTRLVDFGELRESGLPCFGTLERALGFLAQEWGRPGVYPPPAG